MKWLWKYSIEPVLKFLAIGFVIISSMLLVIMPFAWAAHWADIYSPWFMLIWLIWPFILTALWNIGEDKP